MLATGSSALAAIEYLKKANVVNIKLACLIASRDGINNVLNSTTNIEIYCAAIDEELDSKGYIVPGLGDAGDRLFGTK